MKHFANVIKCKTILSKKDKFTINIGKNNNFGNISSFLGKKSCPNSLRISESCSQMKEKWSGKSVGGLVQHLNLCSDSSVVMKRAPSRKVDVSLCLTSCLFSQLLEMTHISKTFKADLWSVCLAACFCSAYSVP